ncbi:aldolase catalytic domain-containing protein [Microbulbifer variabilis]|uniref:aldolase catalytic domain-containing protein n=1 Tax=Microbulbifer variabilis TaxID=266805 RepID=UPI001CFE16E6|nr:aldolase catalytic domain-containing protein [Microbulbifer variabilis]
MMILDCTLRDGGYYNNWDFDPNIVNSYLASMSQAKVDFVELGLRSFPKNGFLGPFAYTTELFLESLELPDGPVYGVMVDAKTILSAEIPVIEAIDKLFINKVDSKIGLVRVAAHFNEVEASGEIVKALKERGYIVGFNLMQAGGKPCDVIAEKAELAVSWDCLDVLYFADSLGNMDSDEVFRIIAALRRHWDGELGIHTHNNMGKALDNTIAAYNKGVTWLDATVTGMGRGAGNAQTENLLAVLNKTNAPYAPKPVYDLVVRHFSLMQKEYGWGSNLLYFLGAQNDVHPTYVQNLLSDERYGPDEIVGAIDYLSSANASSYDGKILEQALQLSAVSNEVGGSDTLLNAFSGREVLIVGSGNSVNRYNSGIFDYIRDRKPVVLVINLNGDIDEDLVDYIVISHNSKFLADKEKYQNSDKPIILPRQRFSPEDMEVLNPHSEIIDYGLQVESGIFDYTETHCVIPLELTAGYALSIALIGGAKAISLVGFDGYDKGDKRQQEMIDLMMAVHDKHSDDIILSLTPTTYPMSEGSIYAPSI